jgi:PBP1b-binding outer membrane lipoprotein LpoB
MKKILAILAIGFLASCGSGEKTETVDTAAAAVDTAAAATVDTAAAAAVDTAAAAPAADTAAKAN